MQKLNYTSDFDDANSFIKSILSYGHGVSVVVFCISSISLIEATGAIFKAYILFNLSAFPIFANDIKRVANSSWVLFPAEFLKFFTFYF